MRGHSAVHPPVRASMAVSMVPNWQAPAGTSKERPSKVSRPTVRVLQRSDGVRPIPRGNPAKTDTYATPWESFPAL